MRRDEEAHVGLSALCARPWPRGVWQTVALGLGVTHL